MVLLPFAGPAMLFVVAALLFVVPFYVGIVGAPSAMEWRAENRVRSNVWSSLSPLLCGSSLVFLLVMVGLEILGEPYSQGEILLYLYLSILLMRFAAAGFINLLLSIPCLILSKKMDRISALAAFVCSWAGLALSRDFLTPQSLIASTVLSDSSCWSTSSTVWPGAERCSGRGYTSSRRSRTPAEGARVSPPEQNALRLARSDHSHGLLSSRLCLAQ